MKAPRRVTAIAAGVGAAVVLGLGAAGGINVFVGSDTVSCGYDFCDEFNGSSVDSTKWLVMNEHADTSNSELACYLPANVVESGGNLTETIKLETVACPAGPTPVNYTGGAIQSKYSFQYGTVDVRAKVAGGQGPWPAVWMLGTNCASPTWLSAVTCNWPGAGAEEIDIVEFYADSAKTTNNQNLISSVTGSTHESTSVSAATSTFHIYTLVWTAASLTFKIDGTTVNTISGSPSSAMFLIINATIGGSNGTPITNGDLPQSSVIDYVHIDAAQVMASAPTFVQHAESTNWGASATTDTVTVSCTAGDRIVVVCVEEGSGASFTTPTNDGTALTWSLVSYVENASEARTGMWTATADTTRTIVITGHISNTSSRWGMWASVWRNSDGFGGSGHVEGDTTANFSMAVTQAQDRSALVWGGGDWNEDTSVARAPLTTGVGAFTVKTAVDSPGNYYIYGGYHADAGTAGAKTVGTSAPTGQKFNGVVIEVKGLAAGGATAAPYRRDPRSGLWLRGGRGRGR